MLHIDHPAKFSPTVLNTIKSCLGDPYEGRGRRTTPTLLDPFAGTGMIHQLRPAWETWGTEIEEEWACRSPYTIHRDCLEYLRESADETWDAIATSPAFGNRMSDHHDAQDDSRRITYRHFLGHKLHPNNSGAMAWGNRYRDFHQEVWYECVRVLKAGGDFVLHISDHIRKGQLQPVSEWHAEILQQLGLKKREKIQITSRRMRFGANRDVRASHEYVYYFKKPWVSTNQGT